MTDDEKFYLVVEKMALDSIMESNVIALMNAAGPERGCLYLFDIAYGMGFAGAKKMASDGIDIQALEPRKLSLIPNNEHQSKTDR